MTAEDRRWFDRWSASHYDPASGEVHLVGEPPPYVAFHEAEHQRQHLRRTLPFRAWQLAERLARALRLYLELQADRAARRALRRRGLWNTENQRASRVVLESYHLSPHD